MALRWGIEHEPFGWPLSAGFRFNPFSHLEASADPHLGDYLVGHVGITVAWDNVPAVVFAPAGGGKTAMRIYTARTCWTALGSNHPFPVLHQPCTTTFPTLQGDLDDHLDQLAVAGAEALLLELAYRPERLLGLDGSKQARVAACLADTLPNRLQRYLRILAETGSPEPLSSILDRSFPRLDLPSAAPLHDLCRVLGQSLPPTARTQRQPGGLFFTLADLLLAELDYRSVFVLIDAVDALPETADDGKAALRWLGPLLEQAPGWAAAKIHIKGFLPAEMEPALASLLPAQGQETTLSEQLRIARIEWTTPLLADVIRHRVFFASDGAFGSLDAISSPALRDVETQLARAVKPLPRELIWLVNQLFRFAAERADDEPLRIEPGDVAEVLAFYSAHAQQLPA